eukprot:TRINITY_DN25429_c0_g1_i2.p1 TRINITY_DN25429_c0_g1~~TRINITY_DN25429_c0_g1_i2.p1  ORF type:complete len:821 (+),score=236.26 TRINITY_DN25429_c0_g1_i2:47-2464(+)
MSRAVLLVAVGLVIVGGVDGGGRRRRDARARVVAGAKRVPGPPAGAQPPPNAAQQQRAHETQQTLGRLTRRVRAVLEQKLNLDRVLNEEVQSLQTGHFDGTAAKEGISHELNVEEVSHLVKRRELRRKAMDDALAGVMEQVSRLRNLMSNFTASGLRAGSLERLQQLQEQSIRAAKVVDEAAVIEKEERDLRRKRGTPTPHGESSMQKVIRNVDRGLGETVGAVTKEMGADEAWERARRHHGSEVETVLKIHDGDHHRDTGGDAGIVSHLIDHDDNVYVLSKPRDSSVHYEDVQLIRDLVLVVILCAIGGVAAGFLRLPLFFGYIAAGVIASPTQLNVLYNIVQIETLAQYGVYLMLFGLGIEFSLDKVRSVWRSAVGGGLLCMLALWCACAVLLRTVFSAPLSEGLLIGFCVSLSSTAVVLKLLTGSEMSTGYGRLLIAILVVQDVCLGLMVAFIPLLENMSIGGVPVAARILASLVGVLGAAAIWARYVSARLFKVLDQSSEMLVVGLCALCFGTMCGTEWLGISMEVGCFIVGTTLSVLPRQQVHKIEQLMRPLQDLFVAIFFAAIGIHIYPTFLLREAAVLFACTTVVVAMKWGSSLLVLRCVCGLPLTEASLVALGLSQLSEFSFVIAAHGKSQGLINREVYFMMLGITAVSLTTTPILWHLHPKPAVDWSEGTVSAPGGCGLFNAGRRGEARVAVSSCVPRSSAAMMMARAASGSPVSPGGTHISPDQVPESVLSCLQVRVLAARRSPQAEVEEAFAGDGLPPAQFLWGFQLTTVGRPNLASYRRGGLGRRELTSVCAA